MLQLIANTEIKNNIKLGCVENSQGLINGAPNVRYFKSGYFTLYVEPRFIWISNIGGDNVAPRRSSPYASGPPEFPIPEFSHCSIGNVEDIYELPGAAQVDAMGIVDGDMAPGGAGYTWALGYDLSARIIMVLTSKEAPRPCQSGKRMD